MKKHHNNNPYMANYYYQYMSHHQQLYLVSNFSQKSQFPNSHSTQKFHFPTPQYQLEY